jgi:enamine deaminase RidA (YjgF/YER057c/UK114 family)
MQVLLPEGWKRPRGYANGVAAHCAAGAKQVHVAGMIGWDAQERFHTDDFAGQARQAFLNIAEVLACAGATPAHIVRMTWYVAALPEVGKAFREIIANYDIPMTAVQVAALIEDRARVEIEVTAVVPA